MQYKKLFDNSEIEFITPFLRLWMSFNNYYKNFLEGITTDRAAINYYKSGGELKKEFLNLLNSRTERDEIFQDSLASFVKLVNEQSIGELKFPDNLFVRNPSSDTVRKKSLVYISPNRREYYFTSGDEERLYEELLENIYLIRCALVHGDFDLEDKTFLELVEHAYKILYFLLEKVFQKVELGHYYCKNRKGTDATGEYTSESSFKVFKGSKICKEVVKSYETMKNRIKSLKEKAKEEEKFFVLNEDIIFSSPSSASSFCLGLNSNGWTDWKNKEGKTLNDILRGD